MKQISLKGKYIFPGIVDMRVFVGEPGYEYKENFRKQGKIFSLYLMNTFTIDAIIGWKNVFVSYVFFLIVLLKKEKY